MAERTRVLGSNLRIRPFRPPQLSLDQGQASRETGRAFLAGAAVADSKFQAEMDRHGSLAGFEAAASQTDAEGLPFIVKSDESNSFARAFNRSQQIVFTTRLQQAYRGKAAELGGKFRNDPLAMQSQMQSWIDGMAQGLPAEFKVQFELDARQSIQPHVAAAWNRHFAQAEKNAKASLDALAAQTAVDTKNNASIAAANPDTVAGAAAMREVLRGYTDYFEQIAARIGNNELTPGQGAERMQAFGVLLGQNIVFGLFDGTPDKEAFFERFLAGDLKIQVPAQSGELLEVNAAETLDAEAHNQIRGYMQSVINARASAEDRARDEEERALDEEHEALWRQFSENPINQDTYLALRNHPSTDRADIDAMDQVIRTQGAATNPEVFEGYYQRIIAGDRSLTPQEIHMRWDLARDAKDDLTKRLDAMRDLQQNNPDVQVAEDRINTRVAGVLRGTLFIDANDQSTARRQAAGALTFRLMQKIDTMVITTGLTVGRLPNGVAEQGDVFDPVNWIDGEIDAIQVVVDQRNEQRTAAQEALTDLQRQNFEITQQLGTVRGKQAIAELTNRQQDLFAKIGIARQNLRGFNKVSIADIILGQGGDQ